MNLEMPSAADTQQLRTLLLVVLGIMIITIPVIALIVVAKVQAQRRQRPSAKAGNPASPDESAATTQAPSHPDKDSGPAAKP